MWVSPLLYIGGQYERLVAFSLTLRGGVHALCQIQGHFSVFYRIFSNIRPDGFFSGAIAAEKAQSGFSFAAYGDS
jgi:hypothetical protein